MPARILTKEQIQNLSKESFNCSQIVAMQWAEEFGYEKAEAARMAAAFGGGLSIGEVCGAVTGAMLVLGWKYGNGEAGELQKKEQLKRKSAEFREKFTARHKTLICRELTGYDFAKPGQHDAARDAGVLASLCPVLVQDALVILEEVTREEEVSSE